MSDLKVKIIDINWYGNKPEKGILFEIIADCVPEDKSTYILRYIDTAYSGFDFISTLTTDKDLLEISDKLREFTNETHEELCELIEDMVREKYKEFLEDLKISAEVSNYE